MSLIEKLENGCVYRPKRWSGDCGELSRVNEDETDRLLWQATERIKNLEVALRQIAGCDWPEPLPLVPSRADWMQKTAKEALE